MSQATTSRRRGDLGHECPRTPSVAGVAPPARRTSGRAGACALAAAVGLVAAASVAGSGCSATAAGALVEARALDDEVQAVLAACAERVPDEAYVDPRVEPACVLPPGLAALLRADLLDDEGDAALPRWEDLARFDDALSGVELEAMLERFVSPDRSLSERTLLDADGGRFLPEPVLAPGVSVRLRRSAAAPLRDAREASPAAGAQLLPSPSPERPFRAERRAELLAERTAERPSGRLRVAVDPGHLGGDYARVESRLYVWERTADGRQRAFAEGDLTLRTALELAKKLEGDGVEVRLTRTGAEPRHRRAPAELRERAVRFDRRLTADPRFLELLSRLPAAGQRRLRAAATLHMLRVQLTSFDLVERVQALEPWRADLFLSLHYNAGAWPTGTRAPTALVGMVRGTVQRHRVYSPTARARALRDAFELDEFNAAAHLGAACLAAMSETLALAVVGANRYVDHTPIVRADGSLLGVDAWNGLVLRAATGPAVLLEGPFMNEGDEAPRLAAALEAPLHTPGTRTERYAEGVARGIRAWAARWLDSERNAFGPVEVGEYRSFTPHVGADAGR